MVGFRLMTWRLYTEVWASEIGMKPFLCYLFLYKNFLAQSTKYHTSSTWAAGQNKVCPVYTGLPD